MRENTDKNDSEYGHFLRSVSLRLLLEIFKETVDTTFGKYFVLRKVTSEPAKHLSSNKRINKEIMKR